MLSVIPFMNLALGVNQRQAMEKDKCEWLTKTAGEVFWDGVRERV